MTTRLLHRTFRSGGYEPSRSALRQRRSGTSIPLGDDAGTLHVGCLPLLRTVDGAERQAVRVDVRGAAGSRRVRVALRLGDERLDGAELCAGGWADVWVPAVHSDVNVDVEVDGLARGAAVVSPQRRWDIHLVHHSHLDIGYTDPQGVVLRNHLSYLDAALSLCDATDDRPDDARFRWTVESALPAVRWLAARPAATVERFVQRVREGRIEITALPFQLYTEACSEEELRRLLRFAVDLRQRHGLVLDSAMHTDVPGAVPGLVDALAEAGVRYLSAAHNWAGRSVPYLTGGTCLSRPFWWRSPSGRRLLVWFTDTAHGMAYMEGNIVGFTDAYELVEELLPAYLDGLASRDAPYGSEVFGWNGPMDDAARQRPPYPHDVLHLRVQGAHADNASPSRRPSDVVERWNATYTWPRLRLSTNRDFFVDVEARHGDALPEHTGDWTDWWADGMGSGARQLGWVRRAQSVLRSAETLHALADACSGTRASPVERIDAAYDDVALFDEHTWGAANPWHDHEEGFDSGAKQWTWKQAVALHASDHAADLLHDGAARLSDALSDGQRDQPSIQVINVGPGPRTDLARVFLPAAVVPLEQQVSLVDARSGRPIPTEVEAVRPEDFPTRPQGRWLRFVARDVPAVGFARFDVVAGDPGDAVPLERSATVVRMGQGDYEVTVDAERGVIASVRYRPSGRELVDADALAGLNECIRDTYATAPFINHMSSRIAARGKELLGERTVAEPAAVVEAVRTPVCDRVVLERRSPGMAWLRTTIEVPHEVGRVEITNRLLKEPSTTKESVYFAFPLATGGRASWELTGGVGGQDIPAVPGAAAHFAFVRHWVAFQEADLAIAWATLEAPLVHLGDIPLPYSPFPLALRPDRPEPGTIYSWALNNIWDTNFPSQQAGEMTFRYALAAQDGSTARALGMRTAAGLTDELVPVVAAGPPVGQALTLDHPLVRVSSIGRSRDGDALVLRLRSVAPEEVTVDIGLGFLRGGRAFVGDGMEGELSALEVRGDRVSVPVPAEGMCTVRLEPEPPR